MTNDESSQEILFAGDPPLKRSTAQQLQHAIERGLESPLTNEQCSVFQAQLVKEWQRGDESRAGIITAIEMFDAVSNQIEALPVEKQPFAWRELGRQLYVYAEREGKNDPVGRLILNIYEAKNTLLVTGDPPLSRHAAESYTEMTAFLHGIIKKAKIRLTPTQRADVIKELTRQFSHLPRETQDQISQADIHWGILRYNWQHASAEEQENFRLELLPFAKNIAPSAKVAAKIESEIESKAETASETDQTAQLAADATETVEKTKELAKNSQFMEAVRKLRLSATTNSPFQFRKK